MANIIAGQRRFRVRYSAKTPDGNVNGEEIVICSGGNIPEKIVAARFGGLKNVWIYSSTELS